MTDITELVANSGAIVAEVALWWSKLKCHVMSSFDGDCMSRDCDCLPIVYGGNESGHLRETTRVATKLCGAKYVRLLRLRPNGYYETEDDLWASECALLCMGSECQYKHHLGEAQALVGQLFDITDGVQICNESKKHSCVLLVFGFEDPRLEEDASAEPSLKEAEPPTPTAEAESP